MNTPERQNRERDGTACVGVAFGLFASILVLVILYAYFRPTEPHVLAALVREPITFLQGRTSNHDGTQTFTFRDGLSQVYSIELPEGMYALLIRRIDPALEERVPWGGVEKERLLQILLRWVESDQEASAINKKPEIWWEVDGKETGVAILRRLEANQRKRKGLDP